ncbi:MAG: PIF1 family DEAD/DEAH box helicase [Candidatus Moraniibacteriota bacterium]
MDQKKAFEILKKGYNVYLTGAAGSGKTYLLNKYIEYLKKNKIGVAKTASTGIAATHMDGMTIHSWSGLGVNDSMDAKKIKKIKTQRRMQKRFEKTKVLILDEISMLHHYQLDLLDKICKSFKDPFLPFGGLQVVLSGDFFQLPPVSKGDDSAKFVVNSKIWSEADLKICYLDKSYRQKDDKMMFILNSIRERKVGQETVDLLNSRTGKRVEGKVEPTWLFSHNLDVDAMNITELKKIDEPAFRYKMKLSGNKYLTQTLKKNCLSPEELYLKKGAKVMFVKNNFEKGYVNGTVGTVTGFNKDGFPKVETENGKVILALPEEWIMEDEGGDILALAEQIPLRLAWAITVHKSQGMTLDAVEMDLSRVFEYGMGYVALSRCARLDGISLLDFNQMALEVNPAVHELDKDLKKQSENQANL